MSKNYTEKPLLQRSQADIDYTESMAAALRKSRPPVNKPVKPDNMIRDEWILSMQPKSTQALIKKHEDPNYVADLTAPLPDNVLANPNATSLDELVSKRQLDPDQVALVEAVRRRPKNSLGQSVDSATTPERKQIAIDHFVHSPPAQITKEDEQRITRTIKTPNAVPAEYKQVWVQLSWLEALVHWFKGNKVESKEQSYGHWTSYTDYTDKDKK